MLLGPYGLQHAAPSGVSVPGSFLPVVPGKSDVNGVLVGVQVGDATLAGASVLVDVPDDDCTLGKLDPVKIKANYPSHWLVTSGIIKEP